MRFFFIITFYFLGAFAASANIYDMEYEVPAFVKGKATNIEKRTGSEKQNFPYGAANLLAGTLLHDRTIDQRSVPHRLKAIAGELTREYDAACTSFNPDDAASETAFMEKVYPILERFSNVYNRSERRLRWKGEVMARPVFQFQRYPEGPLIDDIGQEYTHQYIAYNIPAGYGGPLNSKLFPQGILMQVHQDDYFFMHCPRPILKIVWQGRSIFTHDTADIDTLFVRAGDASFRERYNNLCARMDALNKTLDMEALGVHTLKCLPGYHQFWHAYGGACHCHKPMLRRYLLGIAEIMRDHIETYLQIWPDFKYDFRSTMRALSKFGSLSATPDLLSLPVVDLRRQRFRVTPHGFTLMPAPPAALPMMAPAMVPPLERHAAAPAMERRVFFGGSAHAAGSPGPHLPNVHHPDASREDVHGEAGVDAASSTPEAVLDIAPEIDVEDLPDVEGDDRLSVAGTAFEGEEEVGAVDGDDRLSIAGTEFDAWEASDGQAQESSPLPALPQAPLSGDAAAFWALEDDPAASALRFDIYAGAASAPGSPSSFGGGGFDGMEYVSSPRIFSADGADPDIAESHDDLEEALRVILGGSEDAYTVDHDL